MSLCLPKWRQDQNKDGKIKKIFNIVANSLYVSHFLATSYGLDRSGLESRQRIENLPSRKLSRPALEPTQPSIQWVTGFFPMVKVAGMWSSPLTATECWGYEWMELYRYSHYIPAWGGRWQLHLLPSKSTLWYTVQSLVWATNNVVKS